MSEQTDKTLLKVIIAQNKMILDRINLINEWIVRVNANLERVHLEPLKDRGPMIYSTPDHGDSLFGEELEKLKEGWISKSAIPMPFPTDNPITDKDLPTVANIIEGDSMGPKPRLHSEKIIGTCEKQPKNQYSVTFLEDETEKAVEVYINQIKGWLPKSTIYGSYDNTIGEVKKVYILDWVIEKNFTPKEE